MKLFELVIVKGLRKHLEDNGFFSKYQLGFRKSKSTNDRLFLLSQTIMESFIRGGHVIAAFLDVEKAFSIRQCLAQWTQVQNLPAWSAHLCFVGGSSIFLLEESFRSKLRVSCLQKFTQSRFHKVPT